MPHRATCKCARSPDGHGLHCNFTRSGCPYRIALPPEPAAPDPLARLIEAVDAAWADEPTWDVEPASLKARAGTPR
jgi:hypothetical protein